MGNALILRGKLQDEGDFLTFIKMSEGFLILNTKSNHFEMIKIEINDKEYNVAEGLHEMTFDEYQRVFDFDKDDEMQREKRDSVVVSRLLGEDDDFCLNLPVDAYSKILSSLKWLYDDSIKPKEKMEIEIDRKMYYILTSEKMTTRKFVDLDVISKDEAFPDRYMTLLSIILERDPEKENYHGVDERVQLRDRLKKLKADEIVPLLMGFFLSAMRSTYVQNLYSMACEMEQMLNQEVERLQSS